MILLTEEEIRRLLHTDSGELIHGNLTIANIIKEAQLKKVVEWGNGECHNREHHRDKEWILNRYCPYCWQALLEEVK